MKTSCWSLYRGPGRVGICLGAARGQPAGFRYYRALAPTAPMLKMGHEEYEELYAQILAKLDPQATWDKLHELAGKDADGQQVEPVLLCFERPPFTDTNRCHRRLVAAWFKTTLGHEVPELTGAS